MREIKQTHFRSLRFAAICAAAAQLAACAGAPPAADTRPALAPPPAWQAPLPHDGQAADLARWWHQFDDPLVAQLIAAAQAVSPTLAGAGSRITQARAVRTAAGAALAPSLDGNASVTRGRQDFITPTGTIASAGLQASWEIDLFGGARAGRTAAQARLEGARAGWHDARVALAAEVATGYVALRACEAQRVQTRTDSESREQTARLTQISAHAGFQAPATEALARASAAQGRAQLAAQSTQCDSGVKALAALTGIAEPELRMRLAPATATLSQPAGIAVAAVPAEVLNQRPDLAAAAADLIAASADARQADARRWPRLTLAGTISAGRFESGSDSISGGLWTIGPLTVALPLFDAGTRAANVEAARARYDEAIVAYNAKLRGALREVEDALLQLQSTAARTEDARIAADGFDASYRAADARYRGGLASLFELEDARRNAAQAHSQLIELRRARIAAWITLYRAVGGGWTDLESQPAPPGHPAAARAVNPQGNDIR